MGTGVSLRHSDDDDMIEDGSQMVVKRIPIEVKPRQRLGKLGLRSVKSLGKSKGSSSLRSALSVELEDPETQKVRRDYEMYKLNKENELQNMQKKLHKFETENRKLRAELQTLHNTTRRLREERDQAQEGERQSQARAASIEHDKEKIQRQFKIFRETKESELQNLLKARRDLETKLTKYGHVTREDLDSSSKMELSIGGNPGDWWTVLESEPSMGSSTQLHTPSVKGPELAHTMLEMEGPYMHVNKDDWTMAQASLSQIYPILPQSLEINVIRLFISAPRDVQREVDLLMKDFGPKLKKICAQEGRFLNIVHMPCDDDLVNNTQGSAMHMSRCRQIDQATAFVAFLGDETNRFLDTDIKMGHLNNPGAKPAIFCFRLPQDRRRGVLTEVQELKKRVKDIGCRRMYEYDKPRTGVELAYKELEKVINIELGIEDHPNEEIEDTITCPLDSPETLCGGCLWDTHYNHEELEMLVESSRSTCELGFEKYYDKLSDHVSTAGLLPPLLISASPGCGKSLLLAKWIDLQQQRSNSSLVLYHFVGSPISCTADPVIMIRRITAQLMQYVTSPPALTCDPVRLVEEFPKWLEKVSAKVSGGIILVLDSADRFQNGESQLKFLLDPLPVDLRVVISTNKDTCPLSWRAWPTLDISAFSNKNVKELLRAELAHFGMTISNDLENMVLTHCRTPQTCNPLYVVILASDLAKCSSEERIEKQLDTFLQTPNTLELYKTVLDLTRSEFESHSKTKGLMRKVLQLIFASRNGISDSEMFGMIAGITWNFWAPVCDALMDRYVLTYRSGLLTFAHEEARSAVEQKYLSEPSDKTLVNMRCTIRDYFSKFTMPGDATYRVADELPWLSWQLEDKEGLHRHILDLCIFVKLYGRGRCAELIGYWQYLGVDKITMSEAYYKAMKMMEGMVGQFNGLVTLPRIADVYEALGRFLRDLNLLSEALTPLQRSLELRELALDPDHPSVAQSLHQVAGIHMQQGKFSIAEQIYKQSLEIFETAFGSNHYLVAREIDALALLYQKQGKHELSDPLHKRATSIRKKCKVPRPMSVQRSLDPLRRRTLRLEELAMGADTVELARTLNEIGVLYYLQNNIDTAESFFQRALEVRENVCGPDHPDVAQSLNNLAALFFDRKQYDKARPIYERALNIRKAHFPADHASIASVIKHLGMLYKKMGSLNKAEPLYKEMVEMRERSFGARHPSVATALVNLAVLHSQQGNHGDALPLYEKAVEIYQEGLGAFHPRVAETLKNLALLKYEQGKYDEAAELYKRANEIKELGSQPAGYTAHTKAPSTKSSTDDSASTLRNTRTIHIEPLPEPD